MRFNDVGTRGVLEEGFEARRAAAHQAVKTIGGDLKGYWFAADGEWHVVALIEAPNDPSLVVRANFTQYSSGAHDVVKVISLAEPSDVDAAQPLTYRPPGQQ